MYLSTGTRRHEKTQHLWHCINPWHMHDQNTNEREESHDAITAKEETEAVYASLNTFKPTLQKSIMIGFS